MTAEDLIITVSGLSGTTIGGVFLGKWYEKWLSKKKDTLEIQLKEQVFYKTLIADITEQRKIEQLEITDLKDKVEKLTDKVNELLDGHVVKDEIIDSQKRTIGQLESMVIRLEQVAIEDRKRYNKLISQLDKEND